MKFLAIVACVFVIVYFYVRITKGLRKMRRPNSTSTHSPNSDAGGFLWMGSSDTDSSSHSSSHHAGGYTDCSVGGDFGGSDCGGGGDGGGGGGD